MQERVIQSEYKGFRSRSSTGLFAYPKLAKRILDLLIAIPAFLVALPLGVLIASTIKLDSPGPVLFRQERIGRFGEPFRILKFRTMVWPSEPDVHRRHVAKLVNGDASHCQLRLPEDPRVTRIGSFLRRWSLDELPNLMNVIAGDMSLVGPRPLVVYELEAVGVRGRLRLSVKPGITGLAQVKGRLDVPMHRRSDYDLTYVRTLSVWRDIGLLLMTPYALFRRRGA